MRAAGNRLLAACVALVVLASLIPSAEAARRPSRAEATAIEEVALRACSSAARGCRYERGRVSTRNARFAWATVVGEGFSGVLLKRPRRSSHRFRVIGTQGGGISECSYWRARAPRPVLRDLRISGLVDDAGTVRRCG